MIGLPEAIISMLRGEVGYTAECEDLAKLARMYYENGKGGRPCEFPTPPPELSIDTDAVETMENFLRRCWEQGRADAESE